MAFGNMLPGVPFSFDDSLRSSYHGTFWQLLSPFGLLAGIDPVSSLTLWDAVSSRTTLTIMLVAAAIFAPLIIAYTAWC